MDQAVPSVPVLAVDLDGTLLRSDMLHESFWSALARDWRTPFAAAAAALAGGRAGLKAVLAARARIDPATLPYDARVIARLEAWRAAGGRTALVTASDRRLAGAVAEHLGLFDEVHASAGGENLKGARKAARLAERFGPGDYVYMGDSAADLPAWAGAAKAVTVNAPAGLRRRAGETAPETEHLDGPGPSLGPCLTAMRPHQWLKNALVFLPVLAAHALDGATLLAALAGFAAFSLVASGVYVLNDLLDLAADRAHPRKRRRPVASGALAIGHAGVLAPALLLAGTALSAAVGAVFLAAMAVYLALTTAYSLGLKRVAILDICTLATLYTLRIVAGGAAAGLGLSVWMLAFSLFFFFALAAVKRQAELVDGAARGLAEAGGRGYRTADLPVVASMALGAGYVSVLVMALYIDSPAVRALYATPAALWGICLVLLFWLSRMVLLAHRGAMHDDPVVFAATDRVSLACAGLVLASALAGALA